MASLDVASAGLTASSVTGSVMHNCIIWLKTVSGMRYCVVALLRRLDPQTPGPALHGFADGDLNILAQRRQEAQQTLH